MKDNGVPLNKRKFKQLNWIDRERLRVLWADNTTSWFRGDPNALAANYKNKVSEQLVFEATIAYAEFMLRKSTMAEKLQTRTAFTPITYEEADT